MSPRRDPRPAQIAVLAMLLLFGRGLLGFEAPAGRVLLILATALLTQRICTALWRLPAFDPRSALISGLSLCLLLRTGEPLLAVAAAVATIASKFLIRWNGKHVFNPTNFGLALLMAATGRVWVSPGQWGSAALLAGLVACLGSLVVRRAARSDVTWAFIGFHLAFQAGWVALLGDPVEILLHRLRSGSLLVFAFFMISDPKTTPDSRAGRVVFALLVAAGAFFVQFGLYRPNGLIWSLAAASPLVPLIDRLLPGPRLAWPAPRAAAARAFPERSAA